MNLRLKKKKCPGCWTIYLLLRRNKRRLQRGLSLWPWRWMWRCRKFQWQDAMAGPACCLGVSLGMSCMLIRDPLPVGYAVMKSAVYHRHRRSWKDQRWLLTGSTCRHLGRQSDVSAVSVPLVTLSGGESRTEVCKCQEMLFNQAEEIQQLLNTACLNFNCMILVYMVHHIIQQP